MADVRVLVVQVSNGNGSKQSVEATYLATDGESSVAADVAVVGRRRGSWRRLEMPASLLKEALDFVNF